MNYLSLINTFFGAGLSSAIIYVLVLYINPLVAAIIWTMPFTLIFPIINFYNREKKSNKFISTYLKTQIYTMFLLLVFLYATAHFIEIAPKEDGIYIPLFKGAGVWAGVSIIYYYVDKNINILNFKQKEDLYIH